MKNFWMCVMCVWIVFSALFMVAGIYYLIAKQIDNAALWFALFAINYCSYLGYAKQDKKEE